MDLARILRHLCMTRWRVGLAFGPRVLRAIDQAVRDSHTGHVARLHFAVEGALHGAALLRHVSARERAIDVFSELRVWDTEQNNGVLVYLLLADRDVEIVADRGISARVAPDEWERICQDMEAHFRRNEYEHGAITGVEQITALLERHFPLQDSTRAEPPGAPVIL
ncbi:TPM domain-containing protein [Trinickia caryophylli]|uniref:TLP18.3, Psb32 and MOLO-1 founding protein of phosphatase n=1 Tax=Trinickia caryophylli TaxID=28094 RepID=A0A1X7E7X3_TRICW|nr:TPM domain-containing protein [Trinickia caryophylli]PMS13062.1 hypothetical protein C0Z17_07245 [Trinickia caryophylli]TRX14827.1 hypothetical protein FNF07_26720 [Trinickia caryophylli]WQE14678.1 TPM domain-containing protein [Trinickia caryophylli]SMF28760.1 TLP18.3, Psb32 and MOLO-1 founding protein of phosphatase [Trinickia caryophylli]GLU31899.1 hypothetical protein Busp01_17410 [Trinickia caryophylli]